MFKGQGQGRGCANLSAIDVRKGFKSTRIGVLSSQFTSAYQNPQPSSRVGPELLHSAVTFTSMKLSSFVVAAIASALAMPCVLATPILSQADVSDFHHDDI